MSWLTVVLEDVLQHTQELEVDDLRAQLLVDLTDDRLAMRLAELDGTADEPVETFGILVGRRIAADQVADAVRVRCDEHRLEADAGAIDVHVPIVQVADADRITIVNGDNVEIGWEDARATNRENWEDRVPLHVDAYGLDAYSDPEHLSDVVRDDLAALSPFLPSAGLTGLDLCHLQCHIGTDTVSLARAGATVTGVDFSPSALTAAAAFAERVGAHATWVETDVLDARAAVSGDFDVVYTSIGAINWLDDLDRWAAQIAALLRPGGTFYIRDGHPMLFALDEESPDLTVKFPYFGDGRAIEWEFDSTYVGEGKVAHTRTYEWPHPLSEILGALLRAGLRLLHFDEGKTLPWEFSPRMIQIPGGYAWPEEEQNLMPCTFTIIARRD